MYYKLCLVQLLTYQTFSLATMNQKLAQSMYAHQILEHDLRHLTLSSGIIQDSKLDFGNLYHEVFDFFFCLQHLTSTLAIDSKAISVSIEKVGSFQRIQPCYYIKLKSLSEIPMPVSASASSSFSLSHIQRDDALSNRCNFIFYQCHGKYQDSKE